MRSRLGSLFALGVLALSACNLPLPGVAVQPPPTETVQAPTRVAEPTASEVAPAPSPTAVLPTPTSSLPAPTSGPSPTPGTTIPRYAAGQKVTLTSVRMLDAARGWGLARGATGSTHVVVTQDGGSTWSDVTPPETELPGGVAKVAVAAFRDASTAWVAYSAAGPGPSPQVPVVWRTADAGRTWEVSQAINIDELMGIYEPSDLVFADTPTGWLLVHAGAGMNHDYVAIYRTSDGGNVWTKIVDPFTNYDIQGCTKTGMVFTDAQDGWLTGDCHGVAPGVLLFVTHSAGSLWASQALPPPADVPDLFTRDDVGCGSYSPSFVNPNEGRIVVRCSYFAQTPIRSVSYLYATSDGGASWTAAIFPGSSVFMLNSKLGWALGRDISQTQDGGKTWTQMSKVNWDGQFSFVDGRAGWAIARSGEALALVQTNDGGKSWKVLKPVIGQ